MLSISVILFALVASTTCDVSHLHLSEEEEPSTPHPPPRPYAFAYTAGRFPGHTDRHHAEVSDGSGVVRGKETLNPLLQRVASLPRTIVKLFRWSESDSALSR